MSNGFPPRPPGQNYMRPPPNGFPPFMPGNFQPRPGMPMPTLQPGGSFPNLPPPGMNMPPPTLQQQPGSTPQFPPGFRPPPLGSSPTNISSPSPSSSTPFQPPAMTPPNGFPPNFGGSNNFGNNQGGSGPHHNMFPPRGGPGNAPGLGYSQNGRGPPGMGQGQGPPLSIDHNRAGLPRPPAFISGRENPNSIVPPVKTMKVFVGGIAPGITDQLLTGLFNICGPLYKLNRVTGPSGKPQAFGFAEFDNPDTLLRAVKCLNGVTLPDMTPQGRQNMAEKTLVIKADQKENAFLAEYEKTLMRTDTDDKMDNDAVQRIATIVKAMQDPSADLNALLPSMAMTASDPSGQPSSPQPSAATPEVPSIPDHLKDLNAEELPENQREIVLDQISIFRDQAVKREQEKKRLEDERERQKQAPGYTANQRQWGAPQAGPSQGRPIGGGPQSYNNPVGFVKAQGAESKAAEGRTDEEEEDMRQREIARRKERQFGERLRFIQNQEHHLQSRLSAEANALEREERVEKDNRDGMRAELAHWDDDKLEASGREVFFADRGRWRHLRNPRRNAEYKADVADRQREADETARADQEMEELMKQQMREMEELEQKNRAAGHLTKDKIPIKLAIAGEGPVGHAPTIKIEASRPKPALPFGGGDDDDENAKKKRTVIKLDEDDGISPAERAAAKHAKLAVVKQAIPTSKAELWQLNLRWECITEATINTKILHFIREKMTDYLGELDDDDLVNFVIDKVKARATPDEIVEGVEPVLDEDAESLVISLWRLLAFESTAYAAGLDTGGETI